MPAHLTLRSAAASPSASPSASPGAAPTGPRTMAAPLARYDRTAMLLHWAIGALLVAQIAFGFALD